MNDPSVVPRGQALWDGLTRALRSVPDDARIPPPGARIGAVLVLLDDSSEDGASVDASAAAPGAARIVLTRRRPDLRSHPGQVSFAGGRVEAGETPVEAALREATEEVGLDPTSVTVLGEGPTFYIPPSRFWVVPVVARWDAPHPLVPEPKEVAEVLNVGLDMLTDERRWRHTPLGPREGSTWAWQLDDDLLWGATALVVRMLLDVVVPGWAREQTPDGLGPGRAEQPWTTAPRMPRRARLGAAFPEREQATVPHVSVEQMRAARARTSVVTGERTERAAHAVARAVMALTSATGRDSNPTVTVLAGPSWNGSVGLSAADVMLRAGAPVHVITVGPPRSPDRVNALLRRGPVITALDDHPLDDATGPGDIVIDAMLGIGSLPPLHGRPARAASWLRRHDVPVIAVDLPSGLHPEEGVLGPCVSADVTVALGLPTRACAHPAAQPFIGDLHLADVGFDTGTWAQVGVGDVAQDLYAGGPLVRLRDDAVAGDAGTPRQTG